METTSFVIHAARGVIRAQRTRRAAMLGLLAAAFCLLLLGFTVLRGALNPREHPMWFLLFWAACGWITFTALLLALFDLLMVRVQSRQAQRALREEIARSSAETSPLNRS